VANEEKVIFRSLAGSAENGVTSWPMRRMRHPLFLWMGLRPVFAQHTEEEDRALAKWSLKRRQLVEIGVAEGASAFALREAMDGAGTLYLIDPFHLSRVHWINAARHAAAAAVCKSHNGAVVWIRKFSWEAVRNWSQKIDFLFIDGDHEEKAVRRDWDEWSVFVAPGGCVAFHDARVFEGGWPRANDGPVRVVNGLFRETPLPGWEIVDEVHSLVIVRRSA